MRRRTRGQTSRISDQYLAASEEFGILPWEDPLVFWRHSPLSLVGNIKTPALVMVGEEDRHEPRRTGRAPLAARR